MKIIAEVKHGEYIGQFNRTEIEKFLNLYYDKMGPLKVGSEVDLGKGHDFESKIKSAFRSTSDLINNHADVLKAITTGITVCNTANKDRGEWNVCAYQELNQIEKTECSDEVWDLICNAKEFLK